MQYYIYVVKLQCNITDKEEYCMRENSEEYISRLLPCPERSFFLFGPRGTGKSAWLRHTLASAPNLELLDASLGHFLPAWRAGLKVRAATHPKFYWFDTGVARAAAGWLHDHVDRAWQGTALETLVFHELRVYNEISGKHRPVSYYLTAAGVEVDFIIETSRRQISKPPRIVAIEVKRSDKWNRE